MKAKKIHEEFQRSEDSIKQNLNLGYTNGDDYIEKELSKYGLDSNDFWEERHDMMRESYDIEDFLDIISELEDQLPLNVFIKYISEDIKTFLEQNGKL